jgi:hypothetical protein
LRRAFAYAAASAFDGAVADAKKAAALAPGDARVAAERARIVAMRDKALPSSDGANAAGVDQSAFPPNAARGPEHRAVMGVELFGAAPSVSGPAISAPLNKQPVPLFHARPPREINSPVPPGTAAAARALAAEEAEGECEAHRELGLGGMDIGVEAEENEHAEHGYAPAYSEEGVSGELGSPGGVSFGGDDDDVRSPAGGRNEDPAVGSDGAPAGRAGDDYENENENLSGGGRGSGSLGHVPPNHPARPAVSGATPAREFSGMRGGLSAGPANGSMDVMGGGGGGQSFGNAPQPLAQTLSASVGVLSMQKNKNEGDPTLAQYGEVALGGDESEEDGEEIGSRNPVANAEKDASGDADEDMEDDDA